MNTGERLNQGSFSVIDVAGGADDAGENFIVTFHAGGILLSCMQQCKRSISQQIRPLLTLCKVFFGFGALLILSIISISPLLAEDGRDPFGDYDSVEFVTAGIGPIFFQGDLDNDYDQSIGANMRIGFHLSPPFSMVSSLSLLLLEASATSAASDKLSYDFNLRLNCRLTPRQSFFHPYIEAGGGLTGIGGTNFEIVGGGGIDFSIWEDGALGLQAFYSYIPSESGAALPVYLSFSHWF